MNETTNRTTNQATGGLDRRRAIVAVSLVVGVVLSVPAARVADAHDQVESADEVNQPRVLHNELADTLVRIRGGAVCSGTPITGTHFVVTAAHCVLDGDGEVSASRTVLRDGEEYTAVSVLVDPAYHHSPGPRLDAAVLVMDRVIPGASARLGDVLPRSGSVTLAGFQPLDSDGSLLRGTTYHDRPQPKGTIGGLVRIDTAAAGCVQQASHLEVTGTQVIVRCGLIPGASGGGLFAESAGELVLVGIVSTVSSDLSVNGVVPLAAIHELLQHPAEYDHEMSTSSPTRSFVPVVRS